MLSLRNRLAAVAHLKSSKHRFTVIEYAVLGFAVRVARRFNNVQTPGAERKVNVPPHWTNRPH